MRRLAAGKAKRRLTAFAVLLISFLGVAGKCNYRAKPEYERIFGLPYNQQMAEFHKLSPENQVEMYLYAVYGEPPAYQYVDYLARGGERVVPPIMARLEADEDEYTKSALAMVLARMHRKRYYDLTTHPEIIDRLKVECAKVKGEEDKDDCNRSMQEIIGDL
jgi:hypothetical protein